MAVTSRLKKPDLYIFTTVIRYVVAGGRLGNIDTKRPLPYMSKAQHGVFTINNYTENDITLCRRAIEDSRITYLIFGYEVGEQGTPHLQGYIQFEKRTRFAEIQATYFPRTSIIAARAHSSNNKDYCSKDGNYEEFGEYREMGKRPKNDKNEVFESIRDDILSGVQLNELATRYPSEFIKYHAGIAKMAKTLNTQPVVRFFGPFLETLHNAIVDWDRTLTLVLQGPTGVSKTQFCLSLFERPLLVSNTEELKGFNSRYHDGIIFDDVQVSHWPRNSQLHLVDFDCHRGVNVKGTHIVIPARTVKIFTCNMGYFPFISDPAINRRLLIKTI